MGSSPSRGEIVSKYLTTVGPGAYTYQKSFGEETTSVKIGERQKEKIVESTAGPGDYDADRVDAVTKTKMVNIHMGSSPSRAEIVSKYLTKVGPGDY